VMLIRLRYNFVSVGAVDSFRVLLFVIARNNWKFDDYKLYHILFFINMILKTYLITRHILLSDDKLVH